MATFTAGASRTHCATCGAHRNTHDYTTGACPQVYRPTSLERAEADLVAAEASGDAARVFVARGEVQRLAGRKGGHHL